MDVVDDGVESVQCIGGRILRRLEELTLFPADVVVEGPAYPVHEGLVLGGSGRGGLTGQGTELGVLRHKTTPHLKAHQRPHDPLLIGEMAHEFLAPGTGEGGQGPLSLRTASAGGVPKPLGQDKAPLMLPGEGLEGFVTFHVHRSVSMRDTRTWMWTTPGEPGRITVTTPLPLALSGVGHRETRTIAVEAPRNPSAATDFGLQ